MNFLKFEGPEKVSQKKFEEAALKVLEMGKTGESMLGWVQLPESKLAVIQCKAWLNTVPKNIRKIVVLGIGGSCLGAKAIYEFLGAEKELEFLDNVDGSRFEKIVNKLDWKNTYFLAISKSGETSETLFQVIYILDELKRKKMKPAKHLGVITEEKSSSLRGIVELLKLASLPVPKEVGGRFSVFSNVGLAPLMWAGVPVLKVLEGASSVKSDPKLISDLASYFFHGFQRKESLSVFWIYVDGLRTFGLWLEQLWAESLAKSKDRSGAAGPFVTTPFTCVGATDQHSLLQQFTEGTRDKHFLFMRSERSEKSKPLKNSMKVKFPLCKGRSLGELLSIEASASQRILENLGISAGKLIMTGQDSQSLGALMFTFEWLVATLGEVLNINAFDQPGVEAVKRVILGSLGDQRYKADAL